MDAPLKIAVPAQDGSDHEVVLIYRVSNRLRQWAAITNTRCATKAYEVEAQRLQVWQQIGVIQVVDNGSRARSEAGFYGGVHREAAFDGMRCQQACSDHNPKIGGICAARDGGNGNR